jgi:glycosyltransferase involved in cell wall biosynthesis
MQQKPLHDNGLRTTVIVPCFNEAERLDATALAGCVATRPWLHLLLVDDGSTDDTPAAIEAAVRAGEGRIRSLRYESNRGKGEAVRFGMLAALESGPQLVGYWDADLATPLEEVDAFEALLRQQPPVRIVMGARVKLLGRRIVRSEVRHYFGRAAATCVSALLRLPVYDTQCGAKLFRAGPTLRAALREPFLSRWIFDVEILARWLIGRPSDIDPEEAIVELPVRQWIDIPGSKLRAADFIRAPVDLLRLWWRYGRPLRRRS